MTDVKLAFDDAAFEMKLCAELRIILSNLENSYDESLGKTIRRRLPISGVRINWDE